MHRFITACVSALGEDINEMADLPLDQTITNGHFIKTIAPKLGIKDEVMDMLGYDTATFFANDWAMTCHRSFYQGIPCYYIKHSGIEYVFVDDKDYNKVEFNHDEAMKRHNTIHDLEESLQLFLETRTTETHKEMIKALSAFYAQNKETMLKERILMSSMATWAAPYRDAAALVDKKLHIPELTCSGFLESANMRHL